MIIPPTEEQAESLRTFLAVIAGKFGGLSTAPASFNNDHAAWDGHRSSIMRVLSDCMVDIKNPEAVFKFLKLHKFVEDTETLIKSKSTSGRKKVLRIFGPDGNVIPKMPAAVAGAGAADA